MMETDVAVDGKVASLIVYNLVTQVLDTAGQ